MKITQIVLHDNSVCMGNIHNTQQGTKSMRKIWEKSFGLGRKSLGSDTDTETWS